MVNTSFIALTGIKEKGRCFLQLKYIKILKKWKNLKKIGKIWKNQINLEKLEKFKHNNNYKYNSNIIMLLYKK